MTASFQRDWCLRMDAGGLGKPEETQSSSAEVPLDKGDLGRLVFLQKRCANGADGPRRISADFGSPRTIFHQIMGHGSHALKNLDPGLGARLRRMNPSYSTATEFRKLDLQGCGVYKAKNLVEPKRS